MAATSRRALTTAMLDLASRGATRVPRGPRAARAVGTRSASTSSRPPATRSRRRAGRATRGARSAPAEEYALKRAPPARRQDEPVHRCRRPARSSGHRCRASTRSSRRTWSSAGWMVEKPSKVVARWTGQGVARDRGRGRSALIVGFNIPMSGLVLIGGAAIARRDLHHDRGAEHARVTMAGAMIRAMLAAYRRTLQKTMEQARSMQQVVDAGRPRLARDARTRPSCGARRSACRTRSRTCSSARWRTSRTRRARRRSSTYFPIWYRTSGGSSFAEAGAAGSGGSHLLGLAGARPRRDDVRARDDRQLPVVVWWRRWRRVLRRLVGRWRRRGRRRLLGEPGVRSRTGPGTRRDPRSRPWDAGVIANRRRVIRNCCVSRAMPSGASDPGRCRRTRATRETAFEAALSRKADDLGGPRAQAVEGEAEDRGAHLLAESAALVRRGRARSPCRPSA